MKSTKLLALFLLPHILLADPRTTLNLNGIWQFEQTENAFPPNKFTRKIPVPGLVHLATPRIEQYDNLYAKSATAEEKTDHAVTDLQYDPKYNWYRRVINIPNEFEGQQGILSIKKSKYVTQVYVNGLDVGGSMSCYTPIDLPITHAVQFGGKNEILIRVGDRAWLPSAATGSTDKEKVNYLPGIWDDVELSFTGEVRIHKTLVLPSVKKKTVTVKLLLRNFVLPQQFYGDPMTDTARVSVQLFEKVSGESVGDPVDLHVITERDDITQTKLVLPVENVHPWSPDDPFLYTALVTLSDTKGELLDEVEETFAMRDFERRGKFFYLNGERFYLRGTNVTLHRFFEDPDCQGLPWDRKWTEKLLVHYPKQLNWNAMRVCVGIAPDFWYDIADSTGLMFQNEWLYWQSHGWDEQLRKEYTEWVWADGSHPSIIIWDAINENWDPNVGNVVIPELKKLDPTRIWDAGYMKAEEMILDEMDEPHPYQMWAKDFDNKYPLGNLHSWSPRWHREFSSSAAQLPNEYGWVWLWRNGQPSHLTTKIYPFFLGENSSPEENWEFQAYWLQCQTETLRARRDLAGILAFCYLSDNLGFTGDWWTGDVAELIPSPTLHWFRHCFAPSGVYIDLEDARYVRHNPPRRPGSDLYFNLVALTDKLNPVSGKCRVRLLDASGKEILNQHLGITIQPHENSYIPTRIELPDAAGGYLLLVEFSPKGGNTVISRRYIRVGNLDQYDYFDLKPEMLKN